ncbi:MAG: hypothetical protein L0H59_07805 [Tomitella sp.]|nr:hypothetical protein [Tomitella sp.]
MCKSRAQGGQRCFASAEKRLASADDTYMRAAAGPDAAALHTAIRRRDLALVDSASTVKGAENLAARADMARIAGDTIGADRLRMILTRGAARRERSAQQYRQWQTDHDVTPRPAAETPTGDRCASCGQWAGSRHHCPTTDAFGPTGIRSEPDRAADTDRAEAALFTNLPLTADEYAQICRDYTTSSPESVLHELRESTVDATDMDPLSAGNAVDAWAPAAKRDAARHVVQQLQHVPPSALLPPGARELVESGTVASTVAGRLVYRDGDAWRYVADGATIHPATPPAPVPDEAVPDAVRRDAAADVAGRWAGSFTADPDAASHSLQAAARTEFTHPDYPARTWRERRDRLVLRAQYAATQQWLSDRGISRVTVHRGMGWGEDSDAAGTASRHTPDWYEPDCDGTTTVAPPLNPLSSTSTRMPVAEAFTLGGNDADDRAVLTTSIPATRIASTPRTGMGCLAEHELIVLDGPGQWQLTSDYL